MASERALAVRRATVVGRLNVVGAALAERYSLPVPASFGVAAHSRVDPELARVMELERVADLLEALPAPAKSVKAAAPEQTAAVVDTRTGEQTATVIEAAPKAEG